MTDSFENKLRRALRPTDPGEDFTRSVMAGVARAPATEAKPHRSRRRGRWLAAALAASIASIAVVGVQVREKRERAAGLHARAQLLEALKVTSEKLNIAYRVVHDHEQQPADEKSQSNDRKIEKTPSNNGTGA